MANKRGQLSCTTNAKNTGFASCFEDWKMIAGAFIYDNPRSFTDEELVELQETLQNDAYADVKANRLFPVHNFVSATDSTEDFVIQTYDYGAKFPVRDGDVDWTFNFVDGGNCLAQALRSHNGKKYVLFYDKDFKILGYRKDNKLSAIPQQFIHTAPWKLATGSTAASYSIRFVMLAKYVNDFREFIKADFDLGDIQGLQDIEIVVNSFNQVTGAANMTINAACGSANLYDLFANQLENGTLYTFTDQDGNPISLVSLEKKASDKSFDLVLDAGDFPDSGVIYINGKAPSVLAAAGVEPYEIMEATLEIEGS